MASDEPSGTVARVVRLLQCLAEVEEEISVKELAARLSLAPSTVHRLLQLLRRQGLVDHNLRTQRYRPGLELFRIASLVVGRMKLNNVALPFMREVAAACNETCVLCIYVPATRRVMIVEHVRSPHPLRFEVEQFQPLSLLWGATGRSVLAFLPPAEIAAAMAEGELSPATGQPLPPNAEFLEELAAIRRQGYVLTEGQRIAGAVGLGAPLFGTGGSVLGSLCIFFPKSRFDPQCESDLASVLLSHSSRLSAALGYDEAQTWKREEAPETP